MTWLEFFCAVVNGFKDATICNDGGARLSIHRENNEGEILPKTEKWSFRHDLRIFFTLEK